MNDMQNKQLKSYFQMTFLLLFCLFLMCSPALSESFSRKRDDLPAESLDDLIQIVDRHTRNLESSFSFTIGTALWNELVKNEFEDITDYCSFCCGIEQCSSYYAPAAHQFFLKEIEYFPGWKIANKELRQLTDVKLSDRELETYYAAKEVADYVSGRSELEKERIIHDVLCNWITYTIDETTDEDDNAVGAILNGKANCDGYTDAFYLLCSLAGLEAGYMGYDVYSEEKENGDQNHIWNLVKVNDKWVMVDVTWDDSDGDLPTTYAYYNIGRKRAGQTHIWKDWMVNVPWRQGTEAELRPSDYIEIDVKTKKDLEKTADLSSRELLRQVALLPDDNMRVLFSAVDSSTDDLLSPVLFRAGIKSWKALKLSGNQYILLHDIQYYPEIEEKALTGKEILSCSSRAEMERAVRGCVQSAPSGFVIWYRNGYDFSTNSDALADTLYQMGCTSFSWGSNEYGRVEISDIKYYPEIEEKALTGKEILSCSSRTEMERIVRECMKSMPAGFVLWYKDGYDFMADSDALANTIYRMGCTSFSWSTNGYGRVEVSGIEYYPDFLYCETENEIKQYVRNCVSKKVKEFCVLLPDHLYQSYLSNHCERWFTLMNSLSIPEQYRKNVYSSDKMSGFIIRQE